MVKSGKDDTVTQEDVANRAGVSRAVVSYVLNNGPRKVNADTRQRVLEAIAELGYRPNKHAQRLILGSNAARNSIGIITGGKGYNVLRRPYYNDILAGLFDTAHEQGQYIRFFNFFDALKDPTLFNKNVHRDEISALVLVLPTLMVQDPDHKPILDRIVERIDNIICLEDPIYDLPAVIFDRAAAAHLVTEHLIKLGHRRIGHLALADQRIKGHKQALLEYGLAIDERLIRPFDAAIPSLSSYEITCELIRMEDPPTAIFAATDELAISALAALRDNGLRVPEDIAVASIDNIPLSEMVRPALTTVDIPKYEMGAHAVQFLISQQNGSMSKRASLLLPIELIVRESCGAGR